MSVASARPVSMDLGQAESSRLAWAFVISLILHLLVFGTYQTGKKLGWWQNFHWPAWVQSPRFLTELLKKKEAAQPKPPPREDVPLIFVDVNSAQATPEPPKNAIYYSDKNSHAANPEAKEDTGVPKITGMQQQMVKTEDIPRQKFVPLQPAFQAPQAQEETKAKAAQTPGDLALAKPEPAPRPDEGQAEHTRPRTLQEARARQPENRLPGEKMQQNGGVRRRLEISSLDAKATQFGAYDAMLVNAISQRWFALLDERDYASDARGKVVLQFVLHVDGRITDMGVAENTTSEVLSLICQRAVLDPAPFAPWPTEMRRVIGETRNIQFTFFYN